jgi:hypothetical protein
MHPNNLLRSREGDGLNRIQWQEDTTFTGPHEYRLLTGGIGYRNAARVCKSGARPRYDGAKGGVT